MQLSQNPDEVIDEEKSGADTTRRYLYQAAYAALQSVSLLAAQSQFKEIFCEQQEDILVKLVDDSFLGIQVKSQNEIFGGFKFNDKRILKAIARFTQHEKAFPNKFKRYLLCTNCGFLNTSNSSDLLFCLELLKQNNSLDDCYKRANFSKQLDQIATISKINDLDLISSVLRKTEVTQWASLRDYKIVLSAEVAKLLNAGYQ